MSLAARDLLAAATTRLSAAGVPAPGVDAALLLAHVTGNSRLGVRLLGDLAPSQVELFEELVIRRARREPLQHLTGKAPFRHLELFVGPGVFVPRPETELLIDEVLSFAASSSVSRVVDLCTGSAAIALAVATELAGLSGRHENSGPVGLHPAPGMTPKTEFSAVVGAGAHTCAGACVTVWAVEAELPAAQWAQRNLVAHEQLLRQLGAEVRLLGEDARGVACAGLRAERGRIDVVLSNPPYVPADAVPREPEVRDHDPAEALYAGPDGLDVIRSIVDQAFQLLRPGGLVVIEHADCQGEQAGRLGVPWLLRSGGFLDVSDHPDLAGRPRYTTGRRPGHLREDSGGASADQTGALQQ